MSVYQGRILELIGIEKINGKTYFQIKSFFEEEVKLFWEIDGKTAQNITTTPEFDGKHKYRLSLHTRLDTIKKQYISIITKTYRDKSERIYFACSSVYKKDLDSIINAQSLKELNKLSFLSKNPSNLSEKKDARKDLQSKSTPLKKDKLLIRWLSIAMLSMFFLIMFEYPNNLDVNKSTINKKSVANAKVTSEVILEKTNNHEIPVSVNTLLKNYSTKSTLPSIEIKGRIAYSLPEGYVSFTFDDGPSKYTVEITDILKKYEVGGTFFFIGKNAEKYPDYVRYVQENEYSIGSHSMNHVDMSNLSYEMQEAELLNSTKVIEDITSKEVVFLRPPFGALNEQTKDIIQNYQRKIILWNSDPRDWENRDPDKIFDYIKTTGASGSIILFHESQAVVDALPRIIEYLQEQSLEIVNLQ